jgi:hypothetical protein
MWHVLKLSLYRWESAIMRRAFVLLVATVLFANLAALAVAEEKESPKMLRHVVLFKFKDDASEDQVKAVTDAFAALPKKIDTIKDFEWGTDVSVENKSEGFTHCFVVTFADEKGREVYLPHPAHKDFVKIVGPVLDKVLVVDYWAK